MCRIGVEFSFKYTFIILCRVPYLRHINGVRTVENNKSIDEISLIGCRKVELFFFIEDLSFVNEFINYEFIALVPHSCLHYTGLLFC